MAREILTDMPCLNIEGARQVGKSTLAQQIAASTDSLVLSLDDEATRAAALEDPTGFVGQAGGRLLVVDEVQRLPQLTLAVKSAIDRDRHPGQFILTGSSSLFRVRGLADSLAGRAGRLTLYGFSRAELAESRDDWVSVVAGQDFATIPEFMSSLQRDDYVQLVARGAYPPVRAMGERRRRAWLDDYLQAIVRRDLPELRRIFSPDRAMSLLKLMAANQSGELVKARLAQESDIPASTISEYVDLLVDVWLVAMLPAWSANLTQREIARPKSLIIDSGLATRLCRLGSSHLTGLDYSKQFGSLLEGFVVAELLRQQTWSNVGFDLYHWRDRAEGEVDLIIELDGGRVIAVEVKASTSFQTSHFTHLKTLRDKLGDRLIAGIVLNTGGVGYRYADRLYGLPIASLWDWH